MNIVIPMAGLGSRFASAGYTLPKPLIPVKGRPMYAWAADSIPLSKASRVIFILLRTQPEFEILKADILSRYSAFSPVVLDVPKLTRGQSETVLAAKDLIDNDQPLLIHNADTAFDIDPQWATDAMEKKLDGALLVFKSTEKRWSFSRADENGWVKEVREKQVICDQASTGTYYFGSGRDYVRLASETIAKGTVESGEFYIAPLYNSLVAANGRVRNYPIDRLYCFGTPEDLAATLTTL
jgi:UDP-N-acetylglucosamine diphosphorylase / glucose-1-phosphate thymidylyltransferase / UDP-N-acetylgalactosamine diphosphorylase / glucosamine-1-phosphate N-acetyltransferase / galactosamine-1-phosphate N-acetyltransferase